MGDFYTLEMFAYGILTSWERFARERTSEHPEWWTVYIIESVLECTCFRFIFIFLFFLFLLSHRSEMFV